MSSEVVEVREVQVTYLDGLGFDVEPPDWFTKDDAGRFRDVQAPGSILDDVGVKLCNQEMVREPIP